MSAEDQFGSLLFLRKTGEPGTSFPLCIGTTCIGSSVDADIRLKLKDERLEKIHCIIDVTETGIATILNKSSKAPICVNTVSIKTFKVLRNEDEIDLIGKKFQYLNDNILEEDINRHQDSINKVINTPSKRRQSAALLVNIQSTKKTSNFKTKTPVQKKPSTRKSFNGSHNISMTPERKLNENRKSERPKTTSKLIVSKALGSPRRPKKRRLSMDGSLGKYDKNLKVSERNILLSDNIVSSTILEEELTASQLKGSNKNADFMDLSNRSFSASEDCSVEQTFTRRSSLRTPNRSSFKIRVREPILVKTPKSSNRKTVLTPAKSENGDRILENTPLIHRELLNGTPKSTGKIRKSEKVDRNRISNITSVGSAEFLNLSDTSDSPIPPRTGLSSTDSDPFEDEDSKDPHISQRKSGIESVAERTPKRSNVETSLNSSNVPQPVSDGIKSRQKSFGSFPQSNKSMSTRRKTEGSIPNGDMVDRSRISCITSVGSSVALNLSDISDSPIPPRTGLSSTDSDPFEDEISRDPRLSLGKASPRKSIQRIRQTEQHPKRSSAIKLVGEFSTDNSEETVKDNLNKSNLKRSVHRSNPLTSKLDENLSLNLSRQSDGERDDLATSRASTTRRYFRKSNMDKASGNESSSEDSSLCNLQDESFTSSTPSKSSNSDTFEPLSADRSRRSSRQVKREPSTNELSDIKPIFVPQRRRPLRSYIDESKELSVRLSKPATFQGEPSRRHSEPVVETKDETDSLNQSALSKNNTSTRISARKSTGKYCKSCEISPIKTPMPRHSSVRDSTISIFSQSENDSLSTAESPKYTPKSKRSFSMNQSQPEEEISDAEHKSIASKRLSRTSTSTNKSYNSSVITVEDDSIKGTPENNTSIVILDTPLEKPRRKSYKRLSKTLDSSIDDCAEPTTPKSAIKGRMSKSLPYKPIVEEITPATPQEMSGRSESGFKTPLNTPGLFENIKKSVLRSRSRRLPSNNLMEEWNKAEDNQATKRSRESTESTDRSPKKRKVSDTVEEDLYASFSSFGTDELFVNDLNDQYVAPNTPHDFRNLTDKPLITDPQTKCLTEPRKLRKAPNRRSLHAMRLESQFGEGDKMSSSVSSNSSDIIDNLTDTSVTSRRSRRLSLRAQKDPQMEVEKTPKNKGTPKGAKSPKNDLTNVAGVKKLLSTPNVVMSPKNDLTRIPNLRKLVYPTQQNSPKNDLSSIAGIKKLLGTPKEVKTPRNDLRNVPNLRKLMSPKQQNSPRNDLSDVAGLKKLLSTPKKQKEPKNDLTNVAGVKKLMSTPRQQNSPLNDLTKVPNLRRVMSPKQQNSPRNDLSDVAGLKKLLSTPKKQKDPKNDLTNVAGVKKLMSTPRQQNSPLNDLTKVPNLRRMMSPKQENSPRNDLTDVEGVVNLFAATEFDNNGSDIENNENLFDKLFVKKPIRTYRGKSLSPISRKAMLFGRDQRKTLGDTPVSSPRIEKWLEDQIAAVQNLVVESPRSLRSRRKDESPMMDIIDSTGAASKAESPAPTKRGRVRKVSQKEDIIQQVSEIHSTTEDDKEDVKVGTQPKLRGKQRTILTDELLNTPDAETTPLPKRRGRHANVSADEKVNSSRGGRKVLKKEEEPAGTETTPLPKRRGRHANVSADEKVVSGRRGRKVSTKEEHPFDTETTPLPKRRGRHANISADEKVDSDRGGRKVLKKEEESSDAETTPLPKRRGRHVNVSADGKVVSSRRGREVSTKEEEQSDAETTPLPKRRGRHANVSADEKVDSDRGGRKVLKKEEESSDTETTPLPKRRGRHVNVSADGKVVSSRRGREVSTKEEEQSDAETTPLPKRRGRHANVSADEKVDSNRRGRKALKKEDEPPVATENSNAPKKVLKKEDKNSDTETTPLPKRRGRHANVAGDEKTDSNKRGRRVLKKEDESGDTEVTPLPQRRGRRRNDLVDEIINSDSKKRRMPKKPESTSDEEKDVDIEIKNKRQPKGKNQKAKHATKVEEVAGPTRRTRRQLVIEDDDEITKNGEKDVDIEIKNKKQPKGKNQKAKQATKVEEEIAGPTKRTRRQIVIGDDEVTEEENKEHVQANGPKRKETRRKNQKPDPVPEEVQEETPKEPGPSKTKGRRQPAKTQVDKVKEVEAEETPENSPRPTRQRKGIYKKYGSEFITKSVSFELNGVQEEKKRKAKAVEQTEEAENPIRRSKRTRK